jgi:hypothetical protein
MIAIAAIAILSGLPLGLRFNVLVLVPACVLASAAVAITSHNASFLLSTALAIAGLQIGYLGGAAIRFIFMEAKAPLLAAKSAPTGW